jgi:peptidoglycan/xylan/chitin deacetylase (PgdA/CDA1 family)
MVVRKSAPKATLSWGFGMVNADRRETAAAGAQITRRVLLVAGGLTLLAGCAAEPAQEIQTTAQLRATPAHTPAHTAHRKRRPSGPSRPNNSNNPAGHPVDDEPMYYIHDGRKAIALTIDDGPSPVYTPQVLRLLEEHKVTATFSMIGTEVDANRGVARDVAAAGHTIANHTWTHPDLALLGPTAIAEQMDRTSHAIHDVTGRVPILFRAPYGAWSPAVFQHCARTGMTPVDWSVDPRDWARPGVTSIVSNIMRNTRTGSIILEHDGGGDRAETVAALKIVLPRLLAAGYHFRTP